MRLTNMHNRMEFEPLYPRVDVSNASVVCMYWLSGNVEESLTLVMRESKNPLCLRLRNDRAEGSVFVRDLSSLNS